MHLGFNQKTLQRKKTVTVSKMIQILILASIHCYREGRHGSKRWVNLASFTDATDLFRFRAIPNLKLTTDYVLEYEGETFKILSVENVKGKGMYVEVLAKKVESAVG